MHTITFYPVGNGDTSQIVLANGKRILFDYRHVKKTRADEGRELDLASQLRSELKEAGRSYYDVVAFTHGDADHIENSTEFFKLQHAQKYQGKDRIEIRELWVPAAMILEECSADQRSEEFVIWRSEARHRLKQGSGIRVFSKPDKLKAWLEDNGLTVESRQHVITDAGKVVPGFSLSSDGTEFFCHSPFVSYVNDTEIMRNEAALVFNIRLQQVGRAVFDCLSVGDSTWEILEEIVSATKNHGNADRLEWDLYNIPHHCSYLALSDEKGATETVPKPLIEELLLKGRPNAHVVSSSDPIDDTGSGRSQVQPPHMQARKCYERYLKEVRGGRFFVTMEEPTKKNPKPLVFRVEESGISRQGGVISGAASIITSVPLRAG